MGSRDNRQTCRPSLVVLDVTDEPASPAPRVSPASDLCKGLATGLCIMVFAFCAQRPTTALARPWRRRGVVLGILLAAGLLSYALYTAIAYSLRFERPTP
ncbi:hypothetical protein ACHHYP_20179 [Achlya hypogyna]|uniref:Uncharacterized protein n=1 Tax=Achlya hypogyna TaxID=1202772 RepID=A0A1V9Z0Q8_ACHHY|nr:hypothetical protein ACHHYP_20179 [Achlya hypogyna]